MVNSVETVAPGIWRIRIGEPEPFTPLTYRTASSRLDGLASLPPIPEPPFDLDSVVADLTPRGLALELPTRPDEDFYGGGLQLKSFRQTGLRKRLCVNSDPVADTGDSHAPVPFYLSTAGYGVYIDTFRTATIYFASHSRHGESADVASGTKGINTDFDTLYARAGSGRRVEIDIPTARGADLYIFSGPSMLDALRRYVFFSGGGAMPPLWGLGVWYRCYGSFGQEAATDLAMRLRERAMPCDVYGLEPGWQSHAYSCSFLWDRVRFPDPETFINRMTASGFHLNLWEHAFTHPTAPFYDELRLCAGSHEVFEGIVPDFTTANAQALFSEHHEALARQGVSGFKLDECDGSDFIKSPWTFPDHAKFPGGLD
ncbi:MAG: glycoside hydrolase, partial [Phycisphaerales bacterium]|nr:glycoside hydrolase [Phycisphaerales bacterium]